VNEQIPFYIPLLVTPNSKVCFNCARFPSTCEDIPSKMGKWACWRPIGVALIWKEDEE
jgi:hypothetical protein